MRVDATTTRDGADDVTVVRIHDVGQPAFRRSSCEPTSRRGARSGARQVLPIRWSDNDQTIWPGEGLTLTARYRDADLRGGAPVVTVAGWNVARRAMAAPVRP